MNKEDIKAEGQRARTPVEKVLATLIVETENWVGFFPEDKISQAKKDLSKIIEGGKKTHISDKRIMKCGIPHTGDSTCDGCNMTDEEMEEHNKKCYYETPEDKIHNQAIDDILEEFRK